MLQPGTGLGKAQSLQFKNVDVITRLRNRGTTRFAGRWCGRMQRGETIMRHKLHLAAVIAMSLMAALSAAFAQASGGAAGGTGAASSGVGSAPPAAAAPTNPGSAGISSAPGGQSSTTTGMGAGATSTTTNPNLYQPGAPNASPGTSGTGLSPNGMQDDDITSPGSPGRMGR
jgi:hypothetical protein